MKGYRTYTTAITVFIAAATSLLFRFGIVGGELTVEQVTAVQTALDTAIAALIPVIVYFRSQAKSK